MANSEFLSSFSNKFARLLRHTKEVVSSAKLQMPISLKNKSKSFKYKLKRIGPCRDLSGTQHNNSFYCS